MINYILIFIISIYIIIKLLNPLQSEVINLQNKINFLTTQYEIKKNMLKESKKINLLYKKINIIDKKNKFLLFNSKTLKNQIYINIQQRLNGEFKILDIKKYNFLWMNNSQNEFFNIYKMKVSFEATSKQFYDIINFICKMNKLIKLSYIKVDSISSHKYLKIILILNLIQYKE